MGKISHEVYEEYILNVKVGYEARKKNLDRVRMAEKARKLQEHMAKVNAHLLSKRVPFIPIPKIEQWKEQYTVWQERYDILCIQGPSRIGKTKMAESLFPNPYVTVVNSSGEQDLTGFDFFITDAFCLTR